MGEEGEGVRGVVGGRFSSVEEKGVREEGEGKSGRAHLRFCKTRKNLVGTPCSICTL